MPAQAVGRWRSGGAEWRQGVAVCARAAVAARAVGRSVDRLVGRSVGWSVGRLVGRSVGSSVRRLVGGLVGRLVGWVVILIWLVGCLISRPRSTSIPLWLMTCAMVGERSKAITPIRLTNPLPKLYP